MVSYAVSWTRLSALVFEVASVEFRLWAIYSIYNLYRSRCMSETISRNVRDIFKMCLPYLNGAVSYVTSPIKFSVTFHWKNHVYISLPKWINLSQDIVLKISCYIRKHNKDFQLGPYIVQCPIYTRSFQSPHLFYRSYLVNQCNSICHSSLWYFFVALKQLIPSLYIQFVFWSSEGIVLGTINCVNHSIFFFKFSHCRLYHDSFLNVILALKSNVSRTQHMVYLRTLFEN